MLPCVDVAVARGILLLISRVHTSHLRSVRVTVWNCDLTSVFCVHCEARTYVSAPELPIEHEFASCPRSGSHPINDSFIGIHGNWPRRLNNLTLKHAMASLSLHKNVVAAGRNELNDLSWHVYPSALAIHVQV